MVTIVDHLALDAFRDGAAESLKEAFYNPLLPAMNPLLVTMKEIGAAHDATAAEVAIAYTIAKGALPLVGVTKVEQVLQAKKASEIDFTPAEIQTLEKMAESTGVNAKEYDRSSPTKYSCCFLLYIINYYWN